MSNIIRIKRRATGNAGAPSTLQNAELAFNEVDNTLYYGKGTGGAGGTATTIDAIGGSGSFTTLATDQNISGTKTFAATPNITNLPVDSTHATNKTYVDNGLALKANLNNPTFTGTVSGITAAMVGLGNVDNTSDANKPVSTAQQTALNLKANLNSPTFTGTVGGITAAMVGLGNVTNTSDVNKPVSTAQQTALDLKANLANPTFTGTVGGITKAMVGLSNVDNTSDANKPVSTAQQTALNLKANLASPTFTGTVTTTRITGLADPTDPTDAASKAYVDAARSGLDVKDSVRAATVSNITLSGTQTIDGVPVGTGDRVLVKNQTTASQNGIYTVTGGSWSRANDANTSAKVTSGMFVFVESGTVNADSGFVLTTDGLITLDTTPLTFTQFSGAGAIEAGTGLTRSGNTIAINNNVATLDGNQTFTGTKTFNQTIVGSINGNAATVTTNANLTGDITSVGNTTSIAAGVIVNADINASAAIADTKLATISTAGKVANSATTATNANTVSAIVARDGSGNFSAGTITAALNGNASTATTLQTARTLTIGSSGKTFNGSADVSWSLSEIGAAPIAQTMHIGTTAVAINRASGALTLTGITLDGGTY